MAKIKYRPSEKSKEALAKLQSETKKLGNFTSSMPSSREVHEDYNKDKAAQFNARFEHEKPEWKK